MKRITLIALVALALASCSKEEITAPISTSPMGEVAEVQLHWAVADMTAGDELTRATAATRTIPTDMGAGGAYDDIAPAVHNLWIIQFDGVTPASKMVGAPRFLSTADLATGAARLTESAAPVYTLFVANIRQGNTYNWNLTPASTFADVITRTKTLTNEADTYENFEGLEPTLGKTLLMSAVTNTPVQGGTPLTPVFTRNVAKVTLHLTLSNADMTIVSVQMRNVANRIAYADAALAMNGITETTIYPTSRTLIDYAAETTGMPAAGGATEGFSWYVPRNQQGVVAASATSKEKSMYAPLTATYFEVIVTKGSGTGATLSIFRVYPGADLVSDFNLRANYEYTVNLNVTDIGTDPADSRVETFGNIDYGPGTPEALSNSFILNPAPEGGATRTYSIGIDQVNRYWGGTLAGYGNNPLNVIDAEDNWVVDLIWEDLPGLFSTTPSATAITLANNNGLGAGIGKGPLQTFVLNVPANLPEGNFLLGFKQAGDLEYLWSWHFWVTNYKPDSFNKSVIAAGRYTYPVPGGQVERYADPATGTNLWATTYADNVMMDRALGALETNFTTPPIAGMRGILYYQFGRKDPLPSAGNLAPHAFVVATGPVPVEESAKYPWALYAPTTAVNWTNNAGTDARNAVWNDPAASITVKSIYDPCPPGWQVPANGTWGDFNMVTTHSLARDLGWAYGQGIGTITQPINGIRYWPGTAETDPVGGTIFYPATGSRSGSAITMGYADYWSSTVYSAPISNFLRGQATGVYQSNAYRSSACSVRCISTDNP